MILLEYLKEFQGIIGALAGVIATLIVSQFVKNSGTIKTHQKEFKYTPSFDDPNNVDEYGRPLGGIVTAFEIKGTILFENTSESMKAIHDIKLMFLTNSGEKFKELQDVSTIRKSAGFIAYDKVTHLNLPAKEITAIEVRMYANKTDIGYFFGQNDVYLVFEIANKKIFKNKKVKINIQ